MLVSLAVNFTDVPDVDGFGNEVSFIVICAGLTVCVNTGDVLLALEEPKRDFKVGDKVRVNLHHGSILPRRDANVRVIYCERYGEMNVSSEYNTKECFSLIEGFLQRQKEKESVLGRSRSNIVGTRA